MLCTSYLLSYRLEDPVLTGLLLNPAGAMQEATAKLMLNNSIRMVPAGDPINVRNGVEPCLLCDVCTWSPATPLAICPYWSTAMLRT